MAAERPPDGFWDMKLSDGGLVDIEFCGQYLQLIHAPAGGPLRQNTGEALGALGCGGAGAEAPGGNSGQGLRLQQDLAQLLAVALAEGADPARRTKAFRALMIRTGGAADFRALKARIAATEAVGPHRLPGPGRSRRKPGDAVVDQFIGAPGPLTPAWRPARRSRPGSGLPGPGWVGRRRWPAVPWG